MLIPPFPALLLFTLHPSVLSKWMSNVSLNDWLEIRPHFPEYRCMRSSERLQAGHNEKGLIVRCDDADARSRNFNSIELWWTIFCRVSFRSLFSWGQITTATTTNSDSTGSDTITHTHTKRLEGSLSLLRNAVHSERFILFFSTWSITRTLSLPLLFHTRLSTIYPEAELICIREMRIITFH